MQYNKTDTGLSFECHHGPKECTGNKIMACIINTYPKQEDQLRLINCTSSAIKANPKIDSYPGLEVCILFLNYTL